MNKILGSGKKNGAKNDAKNDMKPRAKSSIKSSTKSRAKSKAKSHTKPGASLNSPFRLAPVCKDYLWGGTHFHDWGLGSDLDRVAEAWMLSTHPDGDNIILDGVLEGQNLSCAVREHPELVSANFTPGQSFPLMVKLIDTAQPSSIQVHPNDNYAQAHESSPDNNGKSELWYVFDSAKRAKITIGFKNETTRAEVQRAIKKGTLPEMLDSFYAWADQCVYVRPGMIHSIGAGVTLAEVHDNSNLAYRLFDYDRVGPDGKKRELQINKALDVLNYNLADMLPPDARSSKLIMELGKQFSMELLVNTPKMQVAILKLYVPNAIWIPRPRRSFLSIICIKGAAEFTSVNTSPDDECHYTLSPGTSLFVPATYTAYNKRMGERTPWKLQGEGHFLLTGCRV